MPSQAGSTSGSKPVVTTVLVLLFFVIVTGYSLWRSFRMWRNRDYFERVVARSSFYPFKSDVRRGLERGWVPFSIGLTSFLVALPSGIIANAEVADGNRTSIWLLISIIFLVIFLVGEVLQITVVWFNRPRWCVPPYLRSEAGVWATRRSRKPKSRRST